MIIIFKIIINFAAVTGYYITLASYKLVIVQFHNLQQIKHYPSNNATTSTIDIYVKIKDASF